jgi:hypothetical protein
MEIDWVSGRTFLQKQGDLESTGKMKSPTKMSPKWELAADYRLHL